MRIETRPTQLPFGVAKVAKSFGPARIAESLGDFRYDSSRARVPNLRNQHARNFVGSIVKCVAEWIATSFKRTIGAMGEFVVD